MWKQFSVTLSNPRMSSPVVAKGAIPDQEWRRMLAFAQYSRDLRSAALLNRDPPWSYRFAFSEGEGVKAPNMPPPIEVRELAMLLRPFILQDETTYFYKIVNLFDKHFVPAEFREVFEAWRGRFSGRDGQELFRVEFRGIVLNSEEGLRLWLNAYQFHRDEDKRAILSQIEGSAVPFEVAEGLFVEMLTCQAEAVLLVGSFIERLDAVPSGKGTGSSTPAQLSRPGIPGDCVS